MRRTIATLLTVTCLALSSVAAQADDRKDIESLYAHLRQVLITDHVEATLGMETPDFVSIGPDGSKMTGKQLVQQMKGQSAMMAIKSMDIHITKLEIRGKNATVTTSFVARSSMMDAKGQMGPKGKSHPVEMSGHMRNTLVKTAGGWKFKTMVHQDAKMTMDGKPFNMGGGPPQGR